MMLAVVVLLLLLSLSSARADDTPAADTLLPHLTYDEINSAFESLAERFPEYVRLTTAQREFNLPSPGQCGESGPCVTQLVHLTNFATLDDDNLEARPEVYISGALHGDERVGPHTVLEFARVLLETEDNDWLAHLLNTRSIYLTPMTNSLGYFANTREENGIDTNRDYPIDQFPEHCMQTVCSRVVNELFRQHLFQLAITFHAGMEAIAMEWGTMSRKRKDLHASPDDAAVMQLAHGLAAFAGRERANTAPYPVGRMNDLVYPVPGGMEDWAYAGNWDPDSRRSACKPSTFGGYPEHKTQYTDAMLRTLNVLVETSDDKRPNELGWRMGSSLLDANSATGHVPRNVRLALMLTDLVEPYVKLTKASWLASGGRQFVVIAWEVGGAFEVDDTEATLIIRNRRVSISPPLTGGRKKTRWSTGEYADRGKYPFKPDFAACFDVSDVAAAEEEEEEGGVEVEVRARVDSAWASTLNRTTTTVPVGFPPQSHWVNARTNPKWDMTNAGKRVRGRLDWFSPRVRVSRPATGGNGDSSGDDEDVDDAYSPDGRRLEELDCVKVLLLVPGDVASDSPTHHPSPAHVELPHQDGDDDDNNNTTRLLLPSMTYVLAVCGMCMMRPMLGAGLDMLRRRRALASSTQQQQQHDGVAFSRVAANDDDNDEDNAVATA